MPIALPPSKWVRINDDAWDLVTAGLAANLRVTFIAGSGQRQMKPEMAADLLHYLGYEAVDPPFGAGAAGQRPWQRGYQDWTRIAATPHAFQNDKPSIGSYSTGGIRVVDLKVIIAALGLPPDHGFPETGRVT